MLFNDNYCFLIRKLIMIKTKKHESIDKKSGSYNVYMIKEKK
jgi:hypothetical protein